MSQLPVTALNAQVAPSRRMGGQESVWQADVSQTYHQHSADPHSSYNPNASKPWLKNPESLESLVPASEREGTNSDGIPKKLAWLARNGYTVHTYEEILSSRTPAPQVSRKERRRLLMERKKAIYENAKLAHESAKAKGPSRRQPPAGLATTTTPRSAYSHQPSPAPECYPSEATMMPYDTPSPAQQIDPSNWMDSYFYEINPAFLPDAALPFDPAALMAEVNELFTHEEQISYGFVPQGYYQAQPDQYYQQPQYGVYPQQGQYSGGVAVPGFPSHPGTQAGNSYNYRR
ncbi:unnamed protein product [Rhizoctonia solani]|uniref:Uncharacterized protein n=1 Tax=Rhizoctonia solani TaxID=456999 RepID=A0A8H3AJC5_9AGAM|nr:unnamed protein product [Rhizoctonia solani]